MKTLIIVLSAFFAFNSAVTAQTVTKKEEQKTIYVCPTHPDKTNSSSGKCPECGMDMVKVTEKIDLHPQKGSQPQSKIVTKYVCPTDGSTSETEGKCSKCGTGMVKITETVDNHPQKGSQPKTKIVTRYVCPMDGTTADIKGECPKCGMDMKEQQIKEDHKH